MKKHLLPIFLFFILIPGEVFSQELIAGGTIGLTGADIPRMDYRTNFQKKGITAGGFLWLKFNEDFGLQLEFNYVEKGSIKRDVSTSWMFHKGYYLLNLGTQSRFAMDYLEMPLLFKYACGETGFQILGGVSYGKLIRERNIIDHHRYPLPAMFNSKDDFCFVIGMGNYDEDARLGITLRLSESLIPVISREYIKGGFYPGGIGNGRNIVVSLNLQQEF